MDNLTLQKEKTRQANLSDYSTSSYEYNKVRRYLDKVRYIGYGVIDYLEKYKLLYQESETNNAFFPIYDENNNYVGAEFQGITGKRFKGIKKGSKHDYGFNVRFSKDDTFDYALFFKSAIDLMSFMDYKVFHENGKLDGCILISMSGLKTNIIQHTLRAFKGNLQVILCVDNDNAGQEFIKEVAGAKIKFSLCLPDKKYKDWNEQLKSTKIGSTIIGRVLKRESEALMSRLQINE